MINKVVLCGRIANDLELKMTESGKKVLDFAIAQSKKGENPEYHDIVAFENRAETISRYFKRGDQIIITGKLSSKTYKYNGDTRKKVNVILEDFDFGAKKKTQEETLNEELNEVEWY